MNHRIILKLDHLVVGALTLEAGVAHVRQALGVEMPRGGAHPLMGTHNHLMQLGEGIFLEVIAPDPAANPQRPRWFALDDPVMRTRLTRAPQLIGWVARTHNLTRALREAKGAKGEVTHATRGELAWTIGVPADGGMAFDGAFPTLLAWPDGPLPQSRMADMGCTLERFEVTHPHGERIAHALAPHVDDARIAITQGATLMMRARIATPTGLRELR